MEYVYYVLTILGILLACLCCFRAPGLLQPRSRQVDLAANNRNRVKKAEQARTATNAEKSVLQRQSMKVPTPWGWPGSQHKTSVSRYSGIDVQQATGVSDTLQRWVDQMISSKQTIEDESYRRRKEASMRALLEDRYGRSGQPIPVRYAKVKPPLLRDPAEPHDQMDNFPSGKLDRIERGLTQQARPSGTYSDSLKKPRFEEKRELRTPWGW